MSFKRSTVVLALLLGLVCAQGALAAKAPLAEQVSTAAIESGNPTVPTVLDSWTFEADQGFAPGFLDGQAGWIVFVASTAQPTISTANPQGGAQHLRISEDPALPAGTILGGISPNLGPQDTTQRSVMDVDLFIGGTGGADYDVVPQAPSQGFLTARVKFSWLGDLLILDDAGSGLTFVDTGLDWTPGVWMHLRIDVDPVANTIDYYLDDVLVYSSVAGVFAGTQMEQVLLLSDNWNVGESGDFDNLVIDTNFLVLPDLAEVPTLGQWGLLALGTLLAAAAFLALRRRTA